MPQRSHNLSELAEKVLFYLETVPTARYTCTWTKISTFKAFSPVSKSTESPAAL